MINIKEQVAKGKKLGQKRLQCYLEQRSSAAGPRTGAGSRLLFCRSAKFHFISQLENASG